MAWTDERIEKLLNLWRQGLSASVCAAHLGGVTRNAVIAKNLRRQTLSKPMSARRISQAKKRKSKQAISGLETRRHFAPYQNPGVNIEELQRPQVDDVVRVKSIEDIADNQCRWPIGDPKSDDFGFCGLERIPGRSYCEGHCARAYESPAVRKRKTHHGEGGGFRFENDNSRKPEKEVETVDT